MIHVSTQAWPVADRVERWREDFGRRVAGMEVLALGGAAERFAIGMAAGGGERAATYHVRLRGVRKVRDRPWLRDGRDDAMFMLCTAGSFRFDQGGTRGEVRPGEALLFSLGLPIILESPAVTFASLQLPRAALAAAAPAAAAGRVFAAHDPRTKLFRAYLDAAARLNMTPLAERHLTELAVDLVANGEARPTAERVHARSAARRSAAAAVMRREAARPELAIGDVATSLGVSARTLERDFAAAETRFGDELAALRLDAAAAALAPGGTARIADVAYDAGFRDLSHFNRRFRDRFGATPSDYRAAQAGWDGAALTLREGAGR